MKYILSFTFVFMIGFTSCNAQSTKEDTIYVAFWNLENLYNTVDDPLKKDEEFLPSGSKEWTEERLDKKNYNLARVIRLMGNGNGPDILGVCEIEHLDLLDSLIAKFLNDFNYRAAGLEAPDERGIENALIYNADKFTLLEVKGDTVRLADGYPTRLILECSLLSKMGDTLFVFINHWPSRRGGELESEKNRIEAARVLKKNVDFLFAKNSESKIIIMGDFNDEPVNVSISEVLNAQPVCIDSVNDELKNTGLYNLAYNLFSNGEGSYKYQDKWNMLDQIIISGNFFNSKRVSYTCNTFEVFKPSIMVTRTGKFAGTPFPTYGGSRYLGGYSDHFPVQAKFIVKGKK